MASAVNSRVISWLVLVVAIAGVFSSSSIKTPPTNVTGTLRGNAEFSCEVKFGSDKVMSWHFNGIMVYSFQYNQENFPEGQDKYSIVKDGSNFTLKVSNLQYSDGGIYTCYVRTLAEKACLFVIDTPRLSASVLNPMEGSTAEYTCTAQFAGPSTDDIFPEQYPQLYMFYNGILLNGTVVDKKLNEQPNIYILTQVLNMLLVDSMNGMELMCTIGTSRPEMCMNVTTKVTVLYSVRNISYTPKSKVYDVGMAISCTADGNPEPNFEWDTAVSTGNSIEGPLLNITKQMIGENNWRCTATNALGGRSYQESVLAAFKVVYQQEEENATDDSWKIAVAITIPICIVIGSLVAVFLYCQLSRKRPPPSNPGEIDLMLHEKNSYSPPDSQLQVPGSPFLTIVCGKDGRKWEEEIRKICEEVPRLGQGQGIAIDRYAVQTYSSLEKVEAKFKGFNNRTKKIDDEKLIIILSMGLKAHVMKYVDSLNSSPVWLPKATIIVDLPAHEIPEWFEKRNIEYIDAQIFDDIGIRKKISQSLFEQDITIMVKKNYSKKSSSGKDPSKRTIGRESSNTDSIAEGLAWAYFVNYINLIGTTMVERIRKFEKTENIPSMSLPRKLFILLPASCYSHPKLEDADPAVTYVGKLENFTYQIAGNTRIYETAVYKFTADRQTYYACVEYCTPVFALHEMSFMGIAELSMIEKNAQLHNFYQFLKKILNFGRSPQFCQSFRLVTYDDKPNAKKISEILAEQIKKLQRDKLTGD